MYVDLDLAEDRLRPRLRDAEDFTALKLVVHGDGDDLALREALGELGSLDGAGEHAWLGVSGLRSLAGDLASSPTWSDGFDKMLLYAGSRGWLSPGGDAVRVHIDRT